MKLKLCLLLVFLTFTGVVNFNFAQNKKITLAVLYFENNSVVDKEKMEPLSKGITDMMITELQKFQAFRVVERHRLNDILDELKLAQTGVVDQSTAQKVGKLLGAQTLLLGSFVNFFGDQMRVDLRIVETETGLTLKAEEVTDDVEDLFDIVVDLTEKVVDELDIELSPDEQNSLDQKKGTVNIESSLYYSQGVDLEDIARENYKRGNRGEAVDSYKDAIELYKLALQKNPNMQDASRKIENLNGFIEEINAPEIKINKVKAPEISILEPSGDLESAVFHRENTLAVTLKAQDENGIDMVSVNEQKFEKLFSGEYYSNVKLNEGLNELKVKAVSKSGNFSEKIIKVMVPVRGSGTIVTIYEPPVTRGIKIVSKKDVINVKGNALDENGVSEVLINNRKTDLLPDGKFAIQMNLEVGENKLVVKTTNKKNYVQVDTFIVLRNPEEIISAGKYYALVIGVNSYSGYWRSLTNAVNDAKEMAQVLKANYTFENVLELYDKDATRKGIIQKLEWLANNLSPEDNLLIFYAGHGQLNKVLNKGYWVPVDATTNSVAEYISNSDIKTFLGGIPSKHTFLITDACFAGDIFRGGQTEQVPFDPNNMEKYYKEVYKKQSRLALTSGGLEEVMDAGKEGHSIFTYYLLKALKDNSKKYIDASQLFNEFRVAVANNSEQTPQLQAVKDTNDEGGQFVFVKK